MSNITTNSSHILTNYPIAGADNSSQGFRDNFSNIKDAFSITSSEISWLQDHAVLKITLPDGSGNSTTAINDLNLSSIINGSYNKFYGTSNPVQTIDATSVDVSLNNGIYQSLSLKQQTNNASVSIRFTNWPATGKYANIRIQLTGASDNSAGIPIVIATQNGSAKPDAAWPAVQVAKTSYHIVEAWSCDGGATVFYTYVGTFTK